MSITNFSTKLEYMEFLFKTLPKPKLFAIITWGCSGSTWLAKVLNSHPEIFCTHALNQHFSYIFNEDISSEIYYFKALAVTATGYKLAGDVHGINRDELSAIRKFFKDDFRDAVLIRNPFDRLISMIYCTKKLKGGYSEYSYILNLFKYKNINIKKITFDIILFAHSVNMLNAIIEEIKCSTKVFKIEEITSSKGKFIELLKYISQDSVGLNSEWLDMAMTMPKVNSHRTHKIIHFTEIELEIIKKILLPETIKIYEEFGYDMNFFKNL